MATGGYKLVSFSWAGGRTDSALDRCKFILHGFCSAIVNANIGWDWDQDQVDGSIDDFREMGGHSSSYPNIAYLLIYTDSYTHDVYRMCVGYNYGSAETALRDQDCISFYTSESSNYKQFGGSLYIGMTKNDSFLWDSTYGLYPEGNGLFLKWMHFSGKVAGSSYYAYSFARANESANLYTYYALIKGSQIGIFCKSNSWSRSDTNGLKGFLCGEIFTSTAHSSDTNTFGCVYLNGFYRTGEYDYSSSSYNILAQSKRSYGVVFWTESSSYLVECCQCSQIFTSSGNNLSGFNVSTGDRVQLRYDYTTVHNQVCSTKLSPGGRWTPCYVYYHCQDQITNGVVSGDSFKGFIDTDLLRGVNPQTPFGQLLGVNGDFCHIGGGFAIGWDSTNTEFLF